MQAAKGEVMYLAELKQKSIADLNEVARDLKIEGSANLRKQELIFAILQGQTEKNGVVYGEGVLETLPDGLAFCALPTPTTSRAPTTSIFRLHRFAGSTSVPVTLFPGRSGLRRRVSVTSLCSKSRRSIMRIRKSHGIKSSLTI